MSRSDWLSAREQRTWRAFLRVNSLIQESLDRDLRRGNGLSLIEYGILVHLSEAAGRRLRMSELADIVIVSRSRLTHQIGRLERDGYVRREPCEEDRRGSWAILTPKGERSLREAAPDHVAQVRALMFDRLGPEDADRLAAILDRLQESLRADPG
ncbi:DNA-binding MarR family transcriptional regulator [Murinocardiopsis flavida]|uniref:DNA-binding MarR family transcriptional regulator n=1 Tax=Murinocardiopsis flavida TaxID=645275 RepID=A0A2P8DHZ9_9ACTN|nr:MarR family transcriptional regulator [Murinocardiopsis flavida]PSK96828.1 DNA-binding MarR family transcriptional regulator [Murinocardiopsis flavida]